jgi:hypothetical protein
MIDSSIQTGRSIGVVYPIKDTIGESRGQALTRGPVRVTALDLAKAKGIELTE